MSTTIEDRFFLILKDQMTPAALDSLQGSEGPFSAFIARWTPPKHAGRGFWEKLSQLSGIASPSWRSAFAGRQKPTPAMIESAAKLWPKYAFWLATGITDATNGHVAPVIALTFPECLYAEDLWANTYFQLSLELNEQLYVEGGVDLKNDAERLAASERFKELAHWVGGRLVNVAYRLAQSETYAYLQEVWAKREKDRVAHIGRIDGSNRPWEARREEMEKAGFAMDVVPGTDPRTSHQSSWDLFYKPQSTSTDKNS